MKCLRVGYAKTLHLPQGNEAVAETGISERLLDYGRP
jgi:hypothetical protein